MTIRIRSPYEGMAGAPQELLAAYLRDPRAAAAARSLQEGSSTAPLQGGWLEGLSRLGQGLLGGYQQGQIAREYEGQAQNYRTTLANALKAKTFKERIAVLGGNDLTKTAALDAMQEQDDRDAQLAAELARMGIGIRPDGTHYMLPGFGAAKGAVAAGVAAATFPYDKGKSAAGQPVTVVNTGSNGIDYGIPPKDMAWVRTPDGKVMLDERGVPLARPIQGTDLFLKTQKQTAETSGDKAQTDAKTARRTRSAERIIAKLEKIKKAVQGGLSGLTGAVEPFIPGSRGKGIKNDIETVLAVIGGDILQVARDESTSGASGYGQLAVQELSRFERRFGSLDLSQPAESLIENVDNMINEYREFMKRDDAERERLGLPPLGGGVSEGPSASGISGDPTKMSPEEIYNELGAMGE